MLQSTFLLTLRQIIRETEDTTTLVFHPSPHLLSYQPGQFITLILSIHQETLQRSYSLSTTPYTDLYPAITVKRVKGGKVSHYLTEELKVGSVLQSLAPAGNFVLPATLPSSYQAVFIGGGSGIVPLFSLIKGLLYRGQDSRAVLIYANSDEKKIIYAEGLKAVETKYKGRLRVMHVLSNGGLQGKGLSGRLTSPKLKALLGEEQGDMYREYFLCGPQGLMDLAVRTLEEQGVPRSRIHQEKFTLGKVQPKAQERGPAKLTIHYEGEKYVCGIDASETLLDVALAQGIDIPFSCSSGMCNTCRAKCLKGKVDMVEDEGLDEEEVAAGYVLTCVGYAGSQEVEITLDE